MYYHRDLDDGQSLLGLVNESFLVRVGRAGRLCVEENIGRTHVRVKDLLLCCI